MAPSGLVGLIAFVAVVVVVGAFLGPPPPCVRLCAPRLTFPLGLRRRRVAKEGGREGSKYGYPGRGRSVDSQRGKKGRLTLETLSRQFTFIAQFTSVIIGEDYSSGIYDNVFNHACPLM